MTLIAYTVCNRNNLAYVTCDLPVVVLGEGHQCTPFPSCQKKRPKVPKIIFSLKHFTPPPPPLPLKQSGSFNCYESHPLTVHGFMYIYLWTTPESHLIYEQCYICFFSFFGNTETT